MNTLLAWSGGLDSTLILHRLLTQSDDTVHCFYLDLSTVEYTDPRAKAGFFADICAAEKIVLPQAAAWLSGNARSFTYEVISVTSINEDEWMTPTVVRRAATLVSGYDRFIMGRSIENDYIHDGKKSAPWYRQLWKDLAPAGKSMEWPLVTLGQGRAHAVFELPTDLKALLISCPKPTIVSGNPKACGNCYKCRLTADAESMRVSGSTVENVQKYLLKRQGVGGYVGSALTDKRYQAGNAGRALPWLRKATGGL